MQEPFRRNDAPGLGGRQKSAVFIPGMTDQSGDVACPARADEIYGPRRQKGSVDHRSIWDEIFKIRLRLLLRLKNLRDAGALQLLGASEFVDEQARKVARAFGGIGGIASATGNDRPMKQTLCGW